MINSLNLYFLFYLPPSRMVLLICLVAVLPLLGYNVVRRRGRLLSPAHITSWLPRVTLIAVAFAATLLLLSGLNSRPPLSFDKQSWEEDEGRRYLLAEDLVQKRILVGKDSTTVRALLGEPFSIDDSSGTWAYYTGTIPNGRERVRYYHLMVDFKKDKVVGVKQVHVDE